MVDAPGIEIWHCPIDVLQLPSDIDGSVKRIVYGLSVFYELLSFRSGDDESTRIANGSQ